MVGLVRTQHLMTHPRSIVHEFGFRCYLRCVWKTATADHPVTFLECMAESGQAGELGAHRLGRR
jgi:hypothetical protein